MTKRVHVLELALNPCLLSEPGSITDSHRCPVLWQVFLLCPFCEGAVVLKEAKTSRIVYMSHG